MIGLYWAVFIAGTAEAALTACIALYQPNGRGIRVGAASATAIILALVGFIAINTYPLAYPLKLSTETENKWQEGAANSNTHGTETPSSETSPSATSHKANSPPNSQSTPPPSATSKDATKTR